MTDQVPPMTGPRRWARRAALSALAGGGLTAAALGGPLAGGALGAEAPGGPSATTDSPSAPTQGAEQQGAGQQQSSGQPSTTTSTTPTPSSTSTTPAASSGPTTSPPAGAEQGGPTVVVQRTQKATEGANANPNLVTTGSGRGGHAGSGAKGGAPRAKGGTGTSRNGPTTVPAGTPNGVAPAPQAIGGEAAGFASLLGGSAVSAQALSYYRIPLFLLPIYRAAAVQYDVPWQILAAINEVETNYGSDLSVSTAGAVGWMQFMPQTWLGYGVDATEAGYADPYNPVDAIFAAARYLHAAGASHNLSAAILAYNHSQAYVESVLLRARLISSYPRSAIATLTDLVDGRPPAVGARVAASAAASKSIAAGLSLGSPSSATAGAVPAAPPSAAARAVSHAAAGASSPSTAGRRAVAAAPAFKPPPPPWVVAERAEAAADLPAEASQLVEMLGPVDGPAVAVQDGRIVHLGHSRSLGRYVVLRDIYGDVFTYAGLGSIAPRYRVPEPRPPRAGRSTRGGQNPGGSGPSAAGADEPVSDPKPTQPATAGHQPPLTLRVRTHIAPPAAAPAGEAEAAAPPGMGRARLFAHPGNPLARAAAARSSAPRDSRWRPLRIGAIVSQGTVLGHLETPPGARAGHLRFAIRPSGDNATIDPRPILANWRELEVALHPRGSRRQAGLVGATAAEVFTMSKGELERAALANPGIEISTCERREIASGAVDGRVLAVLEFLSAAACSRPSRRWAARTGDQPRASPAPGTTRRASSRYPRSTASRSPGTRGAGRSPTPPSRRSSRSAADSPRTASSAS